MSMAPKSVINAFSFRHRPEPRTTSATLGPMFARPGLPGCAADAAAALRLPHLLVALFALVLLGAEAPAAGDEGEKHNADTSIASKCRDCGVLRSIREIRTEHQLRRPDIYVTSPQYLATRQNDPPLIGPVVSFSWGGRNEQTQPSVGALGSPQMPERFVDISYECLISLDDGRSALIEQDDVANLRIGDRVQVVDRAVVRVN
jgi:hypothetical protein